MSEFLFLFALSFACIGSSQMIDLYMIATVLFIYLL